MLWRNITRTTNVPVHAVNPNRTGTKAAAHYELRVGAGATAVIRLRLSNVAPGAEEPLGRRFAQILEARRREADEFYRRPRFAP